jgi:uncharacterized protein
MTSSMIFQLFSLSNSSHSFFIFVKLKYKTVFAIITIYKKGEAMINRDEILGLLKNYKNSNTSKYDIVELGLFGSVARNQASDDSDVDICIKTKTPDMFALVHIKEELQNLLANSIDLVRVRDRMNPYLKKRIEDEAIYV